MMPTPACTDTAGQFDLPEPLRYFAPRRGVYDVAPNFSALGALLPDDPRDAQHFQIDSEFSAFRANKLEARAERFGKYVATTAHFDELAAGVVVGFVAERLSREHPHLIALHRDGAHAMMDCRLTGDRLQFDAAMRQESATCEAAQATHYRDAFDAVCCQVQEDVVVLRAPAGEPDEVVAVHVCAPTRWAPTEKLGQSFVETHAPVPHFERVARAAPALLRRMRDGEPVQRTNWSVEPIDRLNLHPEPPAGVDTRAASRAAWVLGRPSLSSIYLRVERQVLAGLPEHGLILFLIRVYRLCAAELAISERMLLAAGLRSLSPQTLAYKGMSPAGCSAVVETLEGGWVKDSG